MTGDDQKKYIVKHQNTTSLTQSNCVLTLKGLAFVLYMHSAYAAEGKSFKHSGPNRRCSFFPEQTDSFLFFKLLIWLHGWTVN